MLRITVQILNQRMMSKIASATTVAESPLVSTRVAKILPPTAKEIDPIPTMVPKIASVTLPIQ